MRLIKVSEAAELLRVSKRSIYRWIKSGRLSKCVVFLPSGRIRLNPDVLREELEAWDLYHADKRKKRASTIYEN